MTGRARITQKMIDLYDEYTHLTLDRRKFMEQLSELAGSSAAAAAIAPMLAANSAQAAIVAEDDARLATETLSFAAESGTVSGYLATPAEQGGPLPAIVVIHENRGLNPHIRDVARRAALEGFVALAPDFLSQAGGTPEDEDRAREMIGALDPDTTLQSGIAAIGYMKEHPASTGKVGTVGFCWGGGLVNRLATNPAPLDAAVAFYGRVPDESQVANIRAPLLLHYAGLDERINAGIPDFRAALDAAGVDYEMHMYEGVNHAFHNDTSAARYDKDAAQLAWSRTIEFFKRTLS